MDSRERLHVRWFDRRSPVVGPRRRISDGGTTGSDLRWRDHGIGSPMSGPRDRISGGGTTGSEREADLLTVIIFI